MCSKEFAFVPNWRKLANMLTHFPQAVPEIPASNLEKAPSIM
jgi:hypothetical protein